MVGGRPPLPEIKEHIRGEKLVNELLNYNQDVISQLESQFKSLDSIDMDECSNDLCMKDSPYLISKNLELALLKGFSFGEVKKLKKESYFYMVVFNTIKHGDNIVLVYNYIPYLICFFKLLLSYAAIEQKRCHFSEKKGGYLAKDYFFIFDKQLSLKFPDMFIWQDHINEATSEIGCTDKENYVEYFGPKVSNLITLLKWCSRGRIVNVDFSELAGLELIKHLITKDRNNLILNLWQDREEKYLKEVLDKITFEKTYNLLSRFIFIVSDLEHMTNSISNKLKMTVNQGPQKHRGQCSNISYILHRVDKGFRDSMLNHNRVFINYGKQLGISTDRAYIPRHCFSFKNIHINLGKVRWYSAYTRS